MTSRLKQWDIFCTVVDNFGDIGVTWRLARQLADEFDLNVRLWVDDLASFARICPELDSKLDQQYCQQIEIRHWSAEFTGDWQVADVVIEAFACELPARVKTDMALSPTPPLWINLEYLSAETWIDDCHGLPSLQSNGLGKFFFFPGFSARSGGLLREQKIEAACEQWQATPENRRQLFSRFGLAEQPENTRYISIFTYESAALPALLEYWSTASRPTCCLIPQGRALVSVQTWLGSKSLQAGDSWQKGALSLLVLPMTDQDGYDRLLWSCDFNLVRGEDSFLRAQWAARPFLWHIYPQADDIHLEKLEAFLGLYGQRLSKNCREALTVLSLAYDSGDASGAVQAWQALEQHADELYQHAKMWPKQAMAGENLASQLVQFCENRIK